jgi:hypothetical protein
MLIEVLHELSNRIVSINLTLRGSCYIAHYGKTLYVKLKVNVLASKNTMLTLNQIISEATALPDSDKAVLIEKLMESMTEQLEVEHLREGVKIAQKRISEIDEGTVQTIPGDIALAQIRQLFKQ